MKQTMKFKELAFQRNGVAGQCFYQVKYSDGKNSEFIATFEISDTNGVDTDGVDKINYLNCRVTCLNSFESTWRGDNISEDIQEMLDEQLNQTRAKYVYYFRANKQFDFTFCDITKQGLEFIKRENKKLVQEAKEKVRDVAISE